MITVQKVADYNKKSVNWDKFFSAVATIGDGMNSEKDRFDKSDLIEKAMAHFSGGSIQYVNTDGVDHILTNLSGTTQECKFTAVVFYGPKVTQRKTKTRASISALTKLTRKVNVKLYNSHGSNKLKALPDNYAKYLMVVDNHSCGVISVADLTPYIKVDGDGIQLKGIPADKFIMVATPDTTSVTKIESNYKELKNKMQEDFLNQF